MSWDQIILILLAALFLLGPERIPVATRWVIDSLRKMRTMAAGAQDQMRSQLGPEIEELRRQVSELQSLKEVAELRKLRDLDPRRMVGKSILGDQFQGGMAGFLGLNSQDEQATDGADDNSESPASEQTPPSPTASQRPAEPADQDDNQPEGENGLVSEAGADVAASSPTSRWVDDDVT